jgi:hypothetical protein
MVNGPGKSFRTLHWNEVSAAGRVRTGTNGGIAAGKAAMPHLRLVPIHLWFMVHLIG